VIERQRGKSERSHRDKARRLARHCKNQPTRDKNDDQGKQNEQYKSDEQEKQDA
jgi:hypothetical protein